MVLTNHYYNRYHQLTAYHLQPSTYLSSMPTGLDRIQCLCQPDTYAKVLTLVNVTGKTKSNMAHELMEAALKLPKYRALLDEADEAQTVAPKEDPRTESRKGSFHRQPSAKVKTSYKQYLEQSPSDDEVIESVGLDKLTPERLQELQQMLKMLEMMKKMEV